MQPEVLKFLLDSTSHLQVVAEGHAADLHLDDLQAVDRFLPDHDWFEVGDEPEGVRQTVPGLFGGMDLQFEN